MVESLERRLDYEFVHPLLPIELYRLGCIESMNNPTHISLEHLNLSIYDQLRDDLEGR